MEWYWIAAIVLGGIGVLVGFYFLAKKGILGASGMSVLSKISSALTLLTNTLAAATENTALDMIATITAMVNTAVSAAENAYYNDEITADERYDLFQKYFDSLLTAAGIELTSEQQAIVDALVKAACEELGHGLVAAKEAESAAPSAAE